MRFEGGVAKAAQLEAAGHDLGPQGNGFASNFALGALEVGGLQPAHVQIVDLFDNQPTSTGKEALYVDRLVVKQGSVLDLNGVNVFARTVEIAPASTVVGGVVQVVPEPRTLVASLIISISVTFARRPRMRHQNGVAVNNISSGNPL